MLQVFDSWAGELSPSSFKKFSLPYLNRIADELPGRLREKNLEPVPMTVFAKGAWYALEDLCNTKYNVIGLDWLHDPAKTYKIARSKGKTVQGNADPGVLYGGREAITAVVKEMVAGFGGGKQGWIANVVHGKKTICFIATIMADNYPGITPFVNPDDLRFFFEEVKRLTS
jgi:uroporphyrinogen decarboxylase